jgi:hypothetical protein
LGIGDFCEDFIEKTHQDGISHGLIIPWHKKQQHHNTAVGSINVYYQVPSR